MDIDPNWADAGKLAFAAFCGGMTRLLFRPAASFLKTVWLLFGCITCGYYGTPVIMHWWDVEPSYAGAVGASIGFIGLSIAEAALRAADKLDLRDWLRSFLTKKEI